MNNSIVYEVNTACKGLLVVASLYAGMPGTAAAQISDKTPTKVTISFSNNDTKVGTAKMFGEYIHYLVAPAKPPEPA